MGVGGHVFIRAWNYIINDVDGLACPLSIYRSVDGRVGVANIAVSLRSYFVPYIGLSCVERLFSHTSRIVREQDLENCRRPPWLHRGSSGGVCLWLWWSVLRGLCISL